MTTPLLLIEDDKRLSQYLIEALGKENYQVEICCSIEEAETFLSTFTEPPQVVVLDRMLGRQDGAHLIHKFKKYFPQTAILVLSSLDMPSEKARILDLGADEYLSKPFSLEELTARLRLVTRRVSTGSTASQDSHLQSLGNLVIDLKTQNACVGSIKLDLTRKEFQLLTLLIHHPGRVYNRFQILDRIWELERTVESNVVESIIKTLRRKLEAAKSSAKIESKRNLGYWIENK